ncbi:MAG: peptide deformylase [Candidatus Pacebacteria bacterium]|nr:peptide deformylase [Candidatus Paceibacterota bacterium]
MEIKKYKDRVLRKKCQEVKEITPEILKIIDGMSETIKKERGVGLAAPQVGVSKRMIVINLDFMKSGVFEVINPKIIRKSKEEEIGEEGCLSFPNVFLEIKRSKEVEVIGLDRYGRKFEMKAEGILARIFQHEIDHLDGILFFDRLPFIKRLKFKIFAKKK